MTDVKNQEAINSFFEGYGFNTLKEYGQTFFDVINLLEQNPIASKAFKEDLYGKFSSIYRLLASIESVEYKAETIEQFN